MGQNDSDMSISYDNNRNLVTSTLARGWDCPECLVHHLEEDNTYCKVCCFKADEYIVREKDFKKEEWKLGSGIKTGSFFRLLVGKNANTSSELYMSLITYFARIVNLIMIRVFLH